MKKIVLTLDLMDNKAKQKALKTVSTLHGIDSITMEMNTKKLTVTGAVDPVSLVTKLRKYWPETTIVLVGPVKEPEKPAPEKKPEESGGDKKETGGGGDKKPEGDGKKEDAGGGGEKKDGEKKEGDSTKEGEKKGDGDGKKESEKTVAKPVQPIVAPPVYFHMPPQMQYPDMMRGYRPNYYYNSAPHPAQMSMYHHQQQQHYYSPSVEENPNACTIC